MRKTCLMVAGIMILAWSGIVAATGDVLHLGPMVERLGGLPPDIPDSSSHSRFIGDLLVAATAGHPYPIDCLTPLAAEWTRQGEGSGSPPGLLRRLAVRPELESPERIQVGNWLQIHFTTDLSSPNAVDGWDENRNGVPDVVDRITFAAEAFHDVAVRRYGFYAPTGTEEPVPAPWDLFLVRLPDPVAGLTLPTIGSDPGRGAGGFLLVDPDDLMQAEAWGTIPHQLAHASLFSYSSAFPAWWQEASAVWLEKEVTNDLTSHATSVEARLRSPQVSLATDAVDLLPGGYLWPLFLVEAHGGDPSVVRQIWEQKARTGSGTVPQITDAVLKAAKGVSFEAAFLRYGIWNSFTGRHDDGRHYRFGSHLPDPASPSLYDDYPSVARPADTVLEPLATRVIALEGRAARGGLDFHFFGQEGGRWQVAALAADPERPHRSYLVDLDSGASNRGRLRLPWDDVSRVTVFIQNLGLDTAGPGRRIGFTALYDPHYPFMLSAFGARAEAGQIVLEWSTAVEQELLGWNLYRSNDPLQGFTRINGLLLPGGGDSREPTNYLFVDDTALPGQQVYYYLEGLTLEGFAQRSHIVGTRARPHRPPTRSR